MPRIKSKEQLEDLVRDSVSFGEIARKLDYKTVKNGKFPGGVYKFLQTKTSNWGIDTSHFPGKGWAKGKTRESSQYIDKQARLLEADPDDVFRMHSNATNKAAARLLLREGREYKCTVCSNEGTWQKKPLKLQLDHINGDNRDYRRDNLRFMCPNCHSQTDTHSRGKRGCGETGNALP
jgi:5-methylcytosine-specific restriction endonuclease McrA